MSETTETAQHTTCSGTTYSPPRHIRAGRRRGGARVPPGPENEGQGPARDRMTPAGPAGQRDTARRSIRSAGGGRRPWDLASPTNRFSIFAFQGACSGHADRSRWSCARFSMCILPIPFEKLGDIATLASTRRAAVASFYCGELLRANCPQ